MKSVAVMWITVMTLAALALPVQAMGQPAQHRRYKFIDLGTLGGRNNTSLRKAQAAQEVLKARVGAKGIQLGIGCDPGRAVGALVEGFSQP
jgi:hypothetical protein